MLISGEQNPKGDMQTMNVTMDVGGTQYANVGDNRQISDWLFLSIDQIASKTSFIADAMDGIRATP